MPPDEMRRVVLCSGAIYYQLSAARRSRRISDIALVRLEQLSPFPHDLLLKVGRPIPLTSPAGHTWSWNV